MASEREDPKGHPHVCPMCEGTGLDQSTVHIEACFACKGSRVTYWEPWKGWREKHAWYPGEPSPRERMEAARNEEIRQRSIRNAKHLLERNGYIVMKKETVEYPVR